MPLLQDFLGMFNNGQSPYQTDEYGQVSSPGLLGSFGKGLQNNSDSLMQFGLGMLGGKDISEGFQNAAQGYARGSLLDRQRTIDLRNQMQAAARKKAAEEFAKSNPSMAPYANLMAENPEMAGQFALKQWDQQHPENSATYKSLVEAGFRPGTPEFQQAMRSAIGLNKREIPDLKTVERADGSKYTVMWNGAQWVPYNGSDQGGGGPSKEVMDREMKLRDAYEGAPEVKIYNAAAPVYQSMVETAGTDDRASDNNLIYGMAKVLDPGSVVRGEEMSMAQAIATLPEQWQQQAKSAFEGTGRLSPETRAAMIKVARSRVSQYQKQVQARAEQFTQTADRYGVDKRNVVSPLGELPTWEPPQPQQEEQAPPPVTAPTGQPAAPDALPAPGGQRGRFGASTTASPRITPLKPGQARQVRPGVIIQRVN